MTEDRVAIGAVAHDFQPFRRSLAAELIPQRLQFPEPIREHRQLPHLLFDPDQLAAWVGLFVEPVRIDEPKSGIVWGGTNRSKERSFVRHARDLRLPIDGLSASDCMP